MHCPCCCEPMAEGDRLPAVLGLYGDDYYCVACAWLLAHEATEALELGPANCPSHGDEPSPALGPRRHVAPAPIR